MLIPFAIILYFFLIRFAIKKAQQNVNVNKHVLIRLAVLFITIPLIFLVVYLIEGRSGALGSFYLSAYFVGAWLLYIIIETISLFVVKQNKLARTNLAILAIMAFIIAIVCVQFA